MPNFQPTNNCACVTAGDQLEKSPGPAPPVQTISRDQQPPKQFGGALEVSQPQLEEEESTSQLRQKVSHLEIKFEDLLNAASDDLKKRKVPIPQIRRSLFLRRVSDMIDVGLVAGLRHEIQEVDMVDDLLMHITTCWTSTSDTTLQIQVEV